MRVAIQIACQDVNKRIILREKGINLESRHFRELRQLFSENKNKIGLDGYPLSGKISDGKRNASN